MKTCAKCSRELPLESFNPDRQNKDGRHSWCKECRTEARRRYREAHCEEDVEYHRRYREVEVHREKQAEYHRRYLAAHPEYERIYYAAHLEKFAEYNRNRRARKLSATGTHTAADVRAQYERQKGRCFWCEVRVGDGYHVDHVTPLALGGSNGPENLVIACPSCNSAKQATHPMEFAGVMF